MTIVFGVIGCGSWGPKLIRNLLANDAATVKTLCDTRPACLAEMAARWPAPLATTQAADLLADPEIDAVVIATPASTHASLVGAALAAGKHVLVEKPLALDAMRAAELTRLAARQKRVLSVDHTFVFSAPVRKLRELVQQDGLGEIVRYEAERYSRGFPSPDVNVIWDLAVHDLSILQYLFAWTPRRVEALAHRTLAGGQLSEATVQLDFTAGQRAEIRVGWRADDKQRRTRLSGRAATVLYDELDPAGSLAIYREPTELGALSAKNEYQPVSGGEPLSAVVDHFVACIEGRIAPLAGGYEAWRAIRILEAAERSLQSGGRAIDLPAEIFPDI